MARKWLPDNVTAYKDRHGKTRYRFRRRGLPTHHFRSEPGSEDFRVEYREALSAVIEPTQRFTPFTYDELIASYYRTPKWQAMKPSSKRTYRSIIERFRKTNGDKDVRAVNAAAIDRKLAAMKDTPAAANNLRKVLTRLHRHAIKLNWRKDNPAEATDAYPSGKGWHTWTEAEIAQFEAVWPLGTRQNLAMRLLLFTALRLSDMLTVGEQNRDGGELRLKHNKNDSETIIPIAPELVEALDVVKAGNPTYLITEFGKPFTPAGFGNWFRRACRKAELPHCSSHGLRKAMSRMLAESGATMLEGRAITGHKTDKMFSHYAETANKRTLAQAGMGKVVANRKKSSPTDNV